MAKRKPKKVVTIEGLKHLKGKMQELETKDRRKEIFKLARARKGERNTWKT